MAKTLPKRAGSAATYTIWMIIATIAIAWGFIQLIRPDGNAFLGVIAVVGFFLMAMRETSLRRKWKRAQKDNA